MDALGNPSGKEATLFSWRCLAARKKICAETKKYAVCVMRRQEGSLTVIHLDG